MSDEEPLDRAIGHSNDEEVADFHDVLPGRSKTSEQAAADGEATKDVKISDSQVELEKGTTSGLHASLKSTPRTLSGMMGTSFSSSRPERPGSDNENNVDPLGILAGFERLAEVSAWASNCGNPEVYAEVKNYTQLMVSILKDLRKTISEMDGNDVDADDIINLIQDMSMDSDGDLMDEKFLPFLDEVSSLITPELLLRPVKRILGYCSKYLEENDSLPSEEKSLVENQKRICEEIFKIVESQKDDDPLPVKRENSRKVLVRLRKFEIHGKGPKSSSSGATEPPKPLGLVGSMCPMM